MCDLKPIEGSELNEYVINLLHKNNIRTAIEFLALEESKLCKITNLPGTQIASLKVKLRRIYGPKVVDALHYCTPAWKAKYDTGIKNLDLLLGDEFRPGRLYEICGFSAAGKSLFCTTIALNCVQKYEMEILYVDTKRDFSATRVNRMLMAKGLSKENVGRVMQMIKVERCYNLRSLIDVLEKLLICLRQKQINFKLVIVDSLPAIWYLFHGEDGSRIGKFLLIKCANLLKQIAKEYQLLVLCVNVMVRNISEEEPITAKNNDIQLVDVVNRADLGDEELQQIAPSSKPSLGKCWDSVPTIRLTIEDPSYESLINEVSTNRKGDDAQIPAEGMNKNQRVVRVMKSCFGPTGAECTICVNDTGMY